MSFMERARALYHRDDLVRAAFVLAEGIKREPGNEEALNWFLQLYVEELEGPGLEQELLRVLDTQPDGDILLEGIRAELTRRQQAERLTAVNRVCSLRRRAEAADPNRARLVADAKRQEHAADLLDDDDPIRALEETAARRRRRRMAAPVTEPLVPLGVDEEPEVLDVDASLGRRRRRRRPRSETSPQGVLPLETSERPAVDSWRGFQGVAADLDPTRLPAAIAPGSPTDRFPVPAAPPAEASPEPRRRRPRPSVATPAAREDSRELPIAVGPALEETALEPVFGADLLQDDPRTEHSLTEGLETGDNYTLSGHRRGASERRGEAAVDQLLRLEGDDAWSFGGDASPGPAIAHSAPPSRPTGRRLRRGRGRALTKATHALAGTGDGVRAVGRGLRWAAGGRRGPLVLALVAVLSLAGVGYRACTQFSASQLAEADAALRLAQGESLQRAVELYAENVGDDPNPERERLDFARALLLTEYGETEPALDYEAEAALTAYGLAALALHHVAGGNLPVARALGEEAVERFPEEWLAHWTRGRVAVADANWARADEAFTRAAELDERAVLPLLGRLDLALRAGLDTQVEAAVDALEAASPEHPMIPVARATVAFGLSPLETRAAGLQATLPDARSTLLDLRTREHLDVLRARQALAAWQLDQVAQITRSLRERDSGPLGVRANLLEAVLAARRYRLADATAALERALNAAPEGSPATATVRDVATTVFVDLGRPDLALEVVGDGAASATRRAELLIEAGHEQEALRLLSQLMDQPRSQQEALRLLVDFHLRRGVPDRARMRAGALADPGDQAYAAARMAVEAGDWGTARDQAEQALRLDPRDARAGALWARAMSELGFAERGIERIDEQSARNVLVGEFDRARLDVLVASRRAPRETLSEFASLLESTQPTSMRRLVTLARAYEAIGDLERAREAAERVVAGEPANREMHALLGRIAQASGDATAARTHLQRYLELAPTGEPTDWAREMLTRLEGS